MLESIIDLVSGGAIDSHTPQAVAIAVLCAAMIGLFSRSSLFTPDAEKVVGLIRRNQHHIR